MSHQEEGQYQQRAFAVCGGRSLLARVHRQRRRAIDAGGDGSPCMKHTRRGFPRTRTNREIPLFLSPSEERVLACRDDALGSPNTLGILMHFLPWPPAFGVSDWTKPRPRAARSASGKIVAAAPIQRRPRVVFHSNTSVRVLYVVSCCMAFA